MISLSLGCPSSCCSGLSSPQVTCVQINGFCLYRHWLEGCRISPDSHYLCHYEVFFLISKLNLLCFNLSLYFWPGCYNHYNKMFPTFWLKYVMAIAMLQPPFIFLLVFSGVEWLHCSPPAWGVLQLSWRTVPRAGCRAPTQVLREEGRGLLLYFCLYTKLWGLPVLQ